MYVPKGFGIMWWWPLGRVSSIWYPVPVIAIGLVKTGPMAKNGPFEPPKEKKEVILTGFGPMLDSITVSRPGISWANMG